MQKPKSDCFSCNARCLGPLCSLNEVSLRELNAQKSGRTYSPGQIIYYEGNQPFGIYCVETGSLKLTKYTADGKRYIPRIVKAGDLLGYRAFLAEEAYSESAEVLEEAKICFIAREVFVRLMQQDPGLPLRLIQQLGEDLKLAEEKGKELAYDSVFERTAKLLLGMKLSFGRSLPDGSSLLDISLTRDELAGLLGTTVETTVRTLSYFKQRKLITYSKKKIILKDTQALSGFIS